MQSGASERVDSAWPTLSADSYPDSWCAYNGVEASHVALVDTSQRARLRARDALDCATTYTVFCHLYNIVLEFIVSGCFGNSDVILLSLEVSPGYDLSSPPLVECGQSTALCR
jgi:hypothetical protein